MSQVTDPNVARIKKLVTFVEEQGGNLGFSFGDDIWTVAVEFGREAAGSPMVAGASYGMDPDLDKALETVLVELRLSGATA